MNWFLSIKVFWSCLQQEVINRCSNNQGGRSWQPFGKRKNACEIFVRRVFAIVRNCKAWNFRPSPNKLFGESSSRNFCHPANHHHHCVQLEVIDRCPNAQICLGPVSRVVADAPWPPLRFVRLPESSPGSNLETWLSSRSSPSQQLLESTYHCNLCLEVIKEVFFTGSLCSFFCERM